MAFDLALLKIWADQFQQYLPLMGAGISVLGAGSALVSQNKAAKKAEEAERFTRGIQGETLKASVDAQIFAWGEKMILLLAEAHALAMRRSLYGNPQEFMATRDALLAQISGYVDQGRLFFLNDSADLIGLDRPPANRGYRPPVLDAAMLVYQELSRLDPGGVTPATEEAKAIFEMRRVFISELQKALDPRRRHAVLARLVHDRDEEERAVAELMSEANSVDTVNWVDVTPLVDEFEKRHGAGSFWKDRPRPRSQVRRELGK